VALAKYYEDIVERLLEENQRLRRLIEGGHRTADDGHTFLAHVAAHLDASKKVLNEIQDLLTDPQHETRFTSKDYESLQMQRKQEADEAVRKLDEKEMTCRTLISECDRLRSELLAYQSALSRSRKEVTDAREHTECEMARLRREFGEKEDELRQLREWKRIYEDVTYGARSTPRDIDAGKQLERRTEQRPSHVFAAPRRRGSA